MKKNEYKFTFKELTFFLFGKKECPNCGNKNLKRQTQRIYKGRKKSTSINMNLMMEDVYENTFVYECQNCKSKVTLRELTKEK